MTRLPERPHLDQLKKQAKDLLALYRSGTADGFARFRNALPAARGKSDAEIAALGLRLADAQSCVARDYGFASWAHLASFVAARNALAGDRPRAILTLLGLIYAGDITGGSGRAHPTVAARVLDEQPDLVGDDPYLACAVGDLEALRRETAQDPAWVNRAGGPLILPPLVAVTHSSLVRLPDYRERLSAAAKLLLDAGADPNDGESLYHSLENLDCTRLLLTAGARVTGTNALYRALDLDDPEPLRLLLAHGGDANEPATSQPTSDWGTPLLWAIRRRRSPDHVAALLDAGADPLVKTPDDTSTFALALQFGLPQVAELLRLAGGGERISEEVAFVAACAAGDEATARRHLSQRPGLIAELPETQRRLLPELAAEGAGHAVRLMVRLGWPIATRGGDWNASALNHAVFRGDAALTRFLLAHGAHWTEDHGFGDNVLGSLSWASCNTPVDGGDWPACAEALAAHGLPAVARDAGSPDVLIMAGVRRRFSEDVAEVLLAATTLIGD